MIKGARMLDTYIYGYQFNRKLEILKLSFINNVQNKWEIDENPPLIFAFI